MNSRKLILALAWFWSFRGMPALAQTRANDNKTPVAAQTQPTAPKVRNVHFYIDRALLGYPFIKWREAVRQIVAATTNLLCTECNRARKTPRAPCRVQFNLTGFDFINGNVQDQLDRTRRNQNRGVDWTGLAIIWADRSKEVGADNVYLFSNISGCARDSHDAGCTMMTTHAIAVGIAPLTAGASPNAPLNKAWVDDEAQTLLHELDHGVFAEDRHDNRSYLMFWQKPSGSRMETKECTSFEN